MAVLWKYNQKLTGIHSEISRRPIGIKGTIFLLGIRLLHLLQIAQRLPPHYFRSIKRDMHIEVTSMYLYNLFRLRT